MGILSRRGIKIKGTDPKKYAKSKKVGAKAVKTQLKKRQMLKKATGSGKPAKPPVRNVPIPKVVNQDPPSGFYPTR